MGLKYGVDPHPGSLSLHPACTRNLGLYAQDGACDVCDAREGGDCAPRDGSPQVGGPSMWVCTVRP